MAKTAAAKTKVYSKYGREIYVCAKNGGADPDTNLSLRRLMEKAKKDQVPGHVIDKALDKASGVGGEDFSGARYEGFGPAGTMLIVDCLTDNSTRSYNDVRLCFQKNSAKLGGPGSVAHMFDHLAIFSFKGDDEDSVLEALMMADVDVTDIESEGGMITVFAPTAEFNHVRQTLLEAFPAIDFDVEDISYVARDAVTISGDDAAVFEKLLDMLNDCDDVQNVYHNAEVS